MTNHRSENDELLLRLNVARIVLAEEEEEEEAHTVVSLLDVTEQKRAEEEIRRRVADLEVLYENSLSLSVLLEPGIIAQKMIEILSQKLDWHHAAIGLVHPETKHIEFLALNKPGLTPDQTQAEIDRLNKIFASPNQGLSGWVFKHGKTIRSGDVQADKRYLLVFPEIRSGIYVPMMIGERAIGVIAVESRQANRFSAEDERLLKTLAAQSAIAFENARLYQEAVSAAKRKAALHQGGLEIVRAGQEIEALCIALHHAVQQVMPAEAFTVSLLTEDGLEVEAPYLYDWGIRHPNTRLPVGAGITRRVIKSKKPLRIKDVQKTRGVKPILVAGSEPTRSVLSVPLLAQDKIIGVISAQSREPDVYSVEDQIFMETLASEAAVVFENARLFEEIRHRLADLESLSQVSDSLTSAIDLQPLLENILASARKAIPAAEKGTILLTEPDGALRLHAMSGYTDPRLIGLVLPDQKGYAARVARQRIPLKIDDAHAGYEAPYNGTIEEIDAVQSGIAAPLIVKGKVIGVISLDNASRKASFTESDLRLLVNFASSAAGAIENARLFVNLQQSNLELTLAYDATIEGWSHALDLRDKETEGHSQRVTEMSIQLARTLGIGEAELVHVRRGALLHDIGKMGIPDSILLKPDALTDEEWVIMRQHPQHAFDLLSPVAYLKPALDIPYSHHEKWDGSGYPRGLKGEQIPLVARIFAVVDVWDALLSERPYRMAWTKEKTLEHIQAGAGSHFDPAVVEAFMSLITDGK